MNKAVIALTYVYKYALSWAFGGNCRFYPSCSNYCIEAFQKHDFLTASRLTFNRLKSCHPMGRSGYDPVPQSPHTCCCKKAVS